ncbi:ATP-binding protein, partial [Bacillus sp. ISL-55]|uniref:magnesium chelatase subunit ChlI family protein n=1 Tax=Bacillus sp. ISL-55 TaxID=2819134 RepID=UPI001BE6947E
LLRNASVAAMNPCPCGYLGSDTHYCTCSEKQIKAYKNRVSGPVLDRIDILLSLKPVNLKGYDFIKNESSEVFRRRVTEARERQYDRYGMEICNSSVPFEQLIGNRPLTECQQSQLQDLSMKHGLSNRVQIKLIRLARTISDMRGDQFISDVAIEEALKLRRIGK